MSSQRKGGITWTDETWNPIRGCSRVSAGCAGCYAERQAVRFGGHGQLYDGLVENGRWNGQVRMVRGHLSDPLRWCRPRRVFVNSMSDLFHESLTFEEIAIIFGVMAAAPKHQFQVLTKRAGRMLEWFKWIESRPTGLGTIPTSPQLFAALAAHEATGMHWTVRDPNLWPLPNVWIGVSVEHQAAAEERIPCLLSVPAAVRWVSCEPLLGPVRLDLLARSGAPWEPNWTYYDNCLTGFRAHKQGGSSGNPCVNWVVCGGESGPSARPMHPDWARGLRDQCRDAGVPFLFKQWGEWVDQSGLTCGGTLREDRIISACGEVLGAGDGKTGMVHPDWKGMGGAWMLRIGKQAAGRLLDSVVHDEYPMGIPAPARLDRPTH